MLQFLLFHRGLGIVAMLLHPRLTFLINLDFSPLYISNTSSYCLGPIPMYDFCRGLGIVTSGAKVHWLHLLGIVARRRHFPDQSAAT